MSGIKFELLEIINNLKDDEIVKLSREIHNFIEIIRNHKEENCKNKINNIPDSQINIQVLQIEEHLFDSKIVDNMTNLENYISSLKLHEVNKSRKMAKNFYILYNEVNKETIIESLLDSFKNMKINALRKISDDLTLVHISFYKQFKLHKNHTKLIVDGKLPIKVYTKAKHFIDLKDNNKHNDKINTNVIFSISKKLKKQENDNYDWMNKKPIPIKKGNSSNENEMIDIDVIFDFHQYIYKLFNHHKYKVNCDDLCRAFLDEIDTLNLGLYNEYICNYVFMNTIIRINDNMRNKLDILSVDYRYREIILNEVLYFRPDLVIQNNNTLIVIEFKYRLDRKNQKLDALNCIHYKMYGPRILNYLKDNEKETFEDIEYVMYIGFSYSYLNDTSCGIMYEVYNASDVMTDIYKTETFIESMKKSKKRFIKL